MSVIHDAAVFEGYYSVGHVHDPGCVCDHDGCRCANPAKRLQHFDDGVTGVLVEGGGLPGRIAFVVDLQPHQHILGGGQAFMQVVSLEDEAQVAAQGDRPTAVPDADPALATPASSNGKPGPAPVRSDVVTPQSSPKPNPQYLTAQ